MGGTIPTSLGTSPQKVQQRLWNDPVALRRQRSRDPVMELEVEDCLGQLHALDCVAIVDADAVADAVAVGPISAITLGLPTLCGRVLTTTLHR